VESFRGMPADSARTVTLGSFWDGFMIFPSDVSSWGIPPGNSYEYQWKRLTKFAFRKCLILKGMSFAEQNGKRRENDLEKEKAGPNSRTPNAVTYEVKYTKNYGNVKRIFCIFLKLLEGKELARIGGMKDGSQSQIQHPHPSQGSQGMQHQSDGGHATQSTDGVEGVESSAFSDGEGAVLFIVYGVYRWKAKRVAFRNDYCLVCGEARRAVQVRTFDVGHIFWIPILPAGFWKRWVCTVCGQDPHVTTKTIIYSGARRVHFLGGFPRAGRGGGILDWADRGTGGCSATAAASAAHAEGADVESEAGNYSTCNGYRLPVLWGAIVGAGFAMFVPGVRSGEERGGAKLETRKQRRENR